MIVSVSGMGFVGAGAAYDLLSEYDEVESKANSFEFGILYEADGVIDLANKLKSNNSKITSYVPIRRFLSLARFYSEFEWFAPFTSSFLYEEAELFIKSLGVVEYTGFQMHDYATLTPKEKTKLRYNSFLAKIKKHLGMKSFFLLSKEMYVYLECEDLQEKARAFMQRIFDNLRERQGSILMIKHLCPPDMPEICFPYFKEEIRHISLTRDPRDLYVLGKINNTSDFPCNTVENFIRFYKKAFSINKSRSEYCIVVPFEDFCYKYDQTVNLIESFVGLDPMKHKSKTHFKPEESINNTKIFLRYPEYAEDLQKIETELAVFLYPFDNN